MATESETFASADVDRFLDELRLIERDALVARLEAAGSRLAPTIMSVGRHIPGLGHYGPRDLPRRR